jgi:type IV pilus assembly protein PilY1
LLPAAQAGVTDISNTPLSSASNFAVAPNFMFILDDSGSMGWDYLPDVVVDNNKCKRRSDSTDDCRAGDPPYYAAEFNTVYYNPRITYSPAKNFDGSSMGDQSTPTSVLVDPFTSTTTIDLTTQYPEMVYCKNSSDDPYGTNCARNGMAGTSLITFEYPVDTNSKLGTNSSYPDSTFDEPKTRVGPPHYFKIAPKEYCSDANLVTCQLATASSGTYVFPAPVRWCQDRTMANSTSAQSGTSGSTPRCQMKYDSNHTYPRYGTFSRVNIVSGKSYPKATTRSDCAGTTCTYAEEVTNFGNWYAYYRTRLKMMKTSAGRAFDRLDENYRVGFITINPGDIETEYLKISEFNPKHREDWYKTLYQQNAGNRTPLREALSRVGRHYAGKTDGINDGMDDDPVQYSCQQNFALLTTDGYWNENDGQTVDGGDIGNQDNKDLTTDPKWSARSNAAYDGALSKASDTLADVALYYYKTDLRPSGSKGALGTDVSKPNVPTTSKDINPEQHMVTFTLGIVDGLMTYRPDYETAKTGDFANIRAGSSGCSWASGTCNWPVPKSDDLSALDDLWHAAVNGRGKFYLAQDPKALSDGLGDAIASVQTRTASAAASATSSPNITPTDRAIFSSTYTTVEWAGEIVAQDIDPSSGEIVSAIKWSAQKQLDAMVSDTADSRTILTRDPSGTDGLKKFDFGAMSTDEKKFFEARCGDLSQCPDLDATQQADANNGANLVNYLRGQTAFNGTIFRNRTHALGDTVNSKPVYVRSPTFAFADAVPEGSKDYATFKADNATRQAVLYIAANDGMLHAINADNGNELWAYVPRMVMPEMYKLADKNYATQHRYYVDGWIEVMDMFDGLQWRTILVGALNGGGRGYYALDITQPTAPKSLWEFCNSDTLCAVADEDLGLTYGSPVITKRAVDGKWVVLLTSGYNNVSPGNGEGYLYVLNPLTGEILKKVGTGVGDTTTPSGLAKIAVWADNFALDNTGKWVYGGDLLGNFWRFDLTSSSPTVQKLAQLVDGSGRPQSVTTRPELGQIDKHRVIYVGTGRYLGVSDLQDPATWIPPATDAYQQSLYAFKDKGELYSDLRKSLVKQDIIPVTAVSRTSSTNAVDLDSTDGWYVDFNPSSESPGERVNIDPQLVLGTLVVVTNVPNKDACSLGGDSWVYQFDYRSGTYVSTSPGKTVAKKLTNAITVGVVVFRLPDGKLKAIATDAGGAKTPFEVDVGSGTITGRRTSWRELIR